MNALAQGWEYLKHLDAGYDRAPVLRDMMDAYGNDVWNYAFFLTKRPEAADDVAQEVFLAAYNGLYAFRGGCTVKSWLLTITRNKALHVVQSAFMRRVTLTDRLVRKDAAPSAEADALKGMDNRALWETVLRLPRKYREVLILDYHYGLALREIAALLRISEGTVKSRSHRAKKRLSAMLSEGGVGEEA
ncbi:RNA polymerase sigma factor [Paenibacillus xanthanilyticus]|uniref:RNA polymerase sigma factor n=1 Tax=Paenibacillus xanthanilyticus TaxID=1783531 RepID=A0ABV8K9X3_9BACL